MHIPATLWALTAVNLALVSVTLTDSKAPPAHETVKVLRAEGLEIVDKAGTVRAELRAGVGEETILRLKDTRGTIRVKLGAASDGSGLLLIDEETEPAVHLIARRKASDTWPTTTSITLRSTDGREQVLRP